MPKQFPLYQVKQQYNHSTLLQLLTSLIPKDDPLRDRTYEVHVTLVQKTFNNELFTGTSIDKNGNEVSNGDLAVMQQLITVDDEGFQANIQSELDVLNELATKYGDKDEHRLMMTYVNPMLNDLQNLKEGVPLGRNIGEAIFGSVSGLTKMKDVILDLDSADINSNDMSKSNFKDPKVYEQTAAEFGITSLYEAYNKTIDHSTEWQKEWLTGSPDPAKLEEIGGRLRKSIGEVEEKLNHFEKKYLEDAKLPEEKRKIYNITSHGDVEKRDLIATKEEFAKNDTIRAPNGKNWEDHKKFFEKTIEKQLFAARLMQAQKNLGGSESRELRESMQKLIDDCLVDQKDNDIHKPLPPAEHWGLYHTVREEADRLVQKNPAAKGIVDAMELYAASPNKATYVESHKADKWIEGYQKNGFERVGADGRKVVDTDRFADIMAARMLVNSVRGDKKSLNKYVSADEIAAKANELKNDETFKGFLERLNKNPKDMQKALSAAKSGHGGALDDMFRDHVKNLPAGKLENTPLMERYLPTVKERIEALQAQVTKEGIDGSETLHRKAAEIIALRNLAKAERGKKKSLEKPIPVSKPGQGLTSQMTALSNDPVFKKLCNSHWNVTMSLITEGHGGALGEYLRAPDGKKPVVFPDAKKVLYANSIHGRIDEIKAEARALRQNPGNNLRQKAGKLLAEYLTLDVMSRDPKTAKIDETKFNSDIPYSRMDKAVNQGFTQQPQFNNYMKSIDEETLRTKFLDDIATKPQDDLIKDVGKGITEVQQAKERHTQAEKNRDMEKQTDAAQAAPKKNELGAQ